MVETAACKWWMRTTVREPEVPVLNSITPFFVVDDLKKSLDFYRSKLGFEIIYTCGGNGLGDDYFGIVRRDGVMLMLKSITPEIHPQPNHSRHGWARWDAYINTSDPDSLYEEYVGRAVPIHRELSDTSDGLRAFEVIDNSGYVLCFGCPREVEADGTLSPGDSRKSGQSRARLASLRGHHGIHWSG